MVTQRPEEGDYRKLGPVGTIMVGLILFGFGSVLAFVLERSAMGDGAASENWPSVAGKITLSMAGSTGPRDSKTYHPEVSYEYTVDGKTFTSKRISFAVAQIQRASQLEIEEYLKQYPEGADVEVHYDPEDPSTSCLETGLQLGTAFLIGVGCMAVGGLVILGGLVSRVRKMAPKRAN
jgi:hypothetical protein